MNCENNEQYEGMVVCDQCNGIGSLTNHSVCNKCHGSGKMTWLEQVFGKKCIVGSSGFYGFTGVSGYTGMVGTSAGYTGISGYNSSIDNFLNSTSLCNGIDNNNNITYNVGDIVYDTSQNKLSICKEKTEVKSKQKTIKKDTIATLVVKELINDIKNILTGKD